jgi:protein-disulfide isomerase
VYASTAPDQSPYLEKCGKLQDVKVPAGALLKMSGRNAKQRAVFFEDPLCPTCKAVHMRLANDGVLDRIDVTLVMMPLDSRCNWMLEQPMHPGACTVSKQVLEWAYDEQDYLTRAGKKDHDLGRKDEPVMKEVIKQRWGADLVSCIEAKATEQRLNQHLQYAVDNSVPVSTPQIYLGGKRLCDEDTDIGLRFTLSQIAPEVLP